MKIIEDKGLCKTFAGTRGEAVLTRNFGNKDRADKWSVSVVVDGEYKQLARRADYSKAYALAEEAID